MSKPDEISESLTKALEPLGLLVEDITVVPAGKRRLVRVLIDRIVGFDDTSDGVITESIPPVSLDEVADATRVISDDLDASDAMGEAPYTLEVSSPGTDRPLTLPRQFARNVGRLVTVTAEDGAKISGRIVSASSDAVEVLPEQGGKKPGAAAGASPTPITYETITRAVVQVEFARGGDADAEREDQ